MNVSNYTINYIALIHWFNKKLQNCNKILFNLIMDKTKKLDPFSAVREWLNNLEVKEAKLAHRVCQMIPAQCPFERKIEMFGRTLISIPPLCKLNPLYNELIYLRFRAISYLANECGEDITAYC
ncbi:MAG: Mo-dependent nitrogenase C-terminal domain-containing protein [Prochloraceae cyanobacterium]